jgi:hypothetical protein
MSSTSKSDRSFLQIGAITGVVSGIVFLAAFALFPSAVPLGGGTERFILQLMSNSTPFTIDEGLFFVAFLLLLPFFLALYRSLMEVRAGLALLGGIAGVVGVTLFATIASAQTWLALSAADLYSRAGGVERQTVVTMSDFLLGFLGGFFVAAFSFFGIALVGTGVAMLGGGRFGRTYGWLTVAFGVLFLGGNFIPIPPFRFILDLLIAIWSILVGTKLYRVVKATAGVTY